MACVYVRMAISSWSRSMKFRLCRNNWCINIFLQSVFILLLSTGNLTYSDEVRMSALIKGLSYRILLGVLWIMQCFRGIVEQASAQWRWSKLLSVTRRYTPIVQLDSIPLWGHTVCQASVIDGWMPKMIFRGTWKLLPRALAKQSRISNLNRVALSPVLVKSGHG